MKTRTIELLAPAKNAEIGMEAILHGADAVYIGAPMFSARASAGNEIADIERLVSFAHQYNARVYVAFNTILTDEQLPDAEDLISQLYKIGVDAIIVQDMGILSLNIPPIAIHASTQVDNRTVEKVKFLESVGFSQIVLARELNVTQIKNIADQVKTPLEVFVHGALCVSYSGQCYISHAYTGRSANRGACAQFCRLPYRLEDADGKVISKNSHLLSLKDMNRLDVLEELLDAGVSSFKIEGRMKDLTYVKNVTSAYHRKLNEILRSRTEFKRASSGRVMHSFEPSIEKSFNRGFTPYFIDRKNPQKQEVWNFVSPKSKGEKVGTVKAIHGNFFTVAGVVQLNNGDGLCFVGEKGELTGFRVNRVEENRVFPAEMPLLKPKTDLFRNWDQEFEKKMGKPTAERKIDVEVRLRAVSFGFSLSLTDSEGNCSIVAFPFEKQLAKSPQQENVKKQLGKLGNTIFTPHCIEIEFEEDWFIPASQLSEWRRIVVERLLALRKTNYKPQLRKKEDQTNRKPFSEQKLSYLGNVANQNAKRFYQLHEVAEIDPAFELSPEKEVPLMFTKHCIKYALEICPVHQRAKTEFKEPFFLLNNNLRFRLDFDCKKCEMIVYGTNSADK